MDGMKRLAHMPILALVFAIPAVAAVGADSPGADSAVVLPIAISKASIDDALDRMYNFDFDAAHGILDTYLEERPGDPLGLAFRASVHLFDELDRLRILETEFFEDDDKLADKKKVKPDLELRDQMMEALAQVEESARTRLTASAEDVDALFALCMKEGVLTDYRALVEKKGLKSFSSARASNSHAMRLLDLEPNYYDAHLTGGINEYLIGSLPFFVRWFVKIEGVEGNKERAFERLELVADKGRYLGPFARILMSVMALREDQPELAQKLLTGLASDYPENPLLQKELDKVTVKLANGES
jgi:hypothetical protein